MDLWQRITSHMNPPVFFGSAGVIVAFVLFGTLFTETAGDAFGAIQSFLVSTFGWFYVLTASLLLIFVLYLLLSEMGGIRLGGPKAVPEFGYLTWFSMMMAAGMGIGIVFFGVAEPMQHFAGSPFSEGGTEADVTTAMRITFYHWGLHPWAIYAAIAMPLAYFHFRYELPLAPRSLLYPLIGDRIHGPIGHAVDILCTVGTLFGVATSLGLGAMQINTGLSELIGLDESTGVQVILIAVITAIATVSVVSGIHVGIRRLSEFNIGLTGCVLLFVLILGPTLYLLELFVTSLGAYLQHLPEMSFWVDPSDDRWQGNWTLFYWSWWISWSPFVGVFVARISKGRTLREFILAAFIVPTLMGFLWFSVIGGTGIWMELNGVADLTQHIRGEDANPRLALFEVLGQLPLVKVLWGVATLLIVVFFITSSDSGSLVNDMVTSGGDPNPLRSQRVFWALSEGAVAITLLLAGTEGEGLLALRTASLTTGLPMSVFLLVASFGLLRALRIDYQTRGRVEVEQLTGDEDTEK